MVTGPAWDWVAIDEAHEQAAQDLEAAFLGDLGAWEPSGLTPPITITYMPDPIGRWRHLLSGRLPDWATLPAWAEQRRAES